jgi:hypothetical protein
VFEFGCWDGSAHVVALSLVAAVPSEFGVGDLVLDSFGDHTQAEAVGEGDGRGHQGSRSSVVGHGSNEGSVEFKFIEG